MGLLSKTLEKLRSGLEKTRKVFTTPLKDLFGLGRALDEAFLADLEEILVTADLGVDAAGSLIQEAKLAVKKGTVADSAALYPFLKQTLRERLDKGGDTEIIHALEGPTVILVVGVNGVGKTTSIAKLAWHLQNQGKKVLLAAGDTFRAAAIEQLTAWSTRVQVEVVKGNAGADPAAVVFDAADAAVARQADYLVVDTAGRLHTKVNLMKELGKMRDVVARKIPGAPHEVLLVLDATTGQNALAQAKMFKELVQVTGLFLAKLDGTAKGGIVVAIRHALDIPVKFVGLGEKPDDLEPFDAASFVDALFE